MQDTNENNFRRRAEDRTESGGAPTVADAWHRAGLAHKRLFEFDARVAAIERAFVKDDLGTPDLEGHRKAHRELIEAGKVMDGYKNEATKKLIGWALAIILGAMSSGVVLWIKDHLK